MSARRNRSSFSTRSAPKDFAFSVSQVLTPRDHRHAEHARVFRHPRANSAEAQQPERASGQVHAHGALPRAFVHAPAFETEMAHRRDHQSPRQLGRRVHHVGEKRIGEIRVRNYYAVLRRRRHVEVGQVHPDDRDQLEIRQSLEQAARQAHPLAHGAEHVERLQRDGSLILREMLIENCYLGLAVERRPVRKLNRNLRVVVEDSNLDHDFWLTSLRLIGCRSMRRGCDVQFEVAQWNSHGCQMITSPGSPVISITRTGTPRTIAPSVMNRRTRSTLSSRDHRARSQGSARFNFLRTSAERPSSAGPRPAANFSTIR